MLLPLSEGASTEPSFLVPFAISLVEFNDEMVYLSLGGEDEVGVGVYDWETSTAAVGVYGGEEWVVQSGGYQEEVEGVKTGFFFRVGKITDARVTDGEYDDRFTLVYQKDSPAKTLWRVTDPFAHMEMDLTVTRFADKEEGTATLLHHGNGKYYVLQGEEDGSVVIGETVFAPDELTRRCAACDETAAE